MHNNAQFFKRVKYLIGMKVNFFSNILPAAAKVRKILPWDIFFIQIKCNKWCIPFYHEISLKRVSVFQWKMATAHFVFYISILKLTINHLVFKNSPFSHLFCSMMECHDGFCCEKKEQNWSSRTNEKWSQPD